MCHGKNGDGKGQVGADMKLKVSDFTCLRALIVGATVGPIAQLVIFTLLGRSHIYFRNFAEISTLFAYTILVSTVSFMVYLAMLRKEMKSNPARSQHFFHRA
jgi:hypothetical protein